MLSDPEIVDDVKVTHRDDSRTRPDCKLVTLGRPVDTSTCTIHSQQYQRRSPLSVLQNPNKSISICTAGCDLISLGAPIDPSNTSSMLAKRMGQGHVTSIDFVNVDLSQLCRNCQLGFVTVPAMHS